MDRLSQHDIVVMMLALGTLLAAARVLEETARYVKQPAVLGEILAGILLGPSGLGRIAPKGAIPVATVRDEADRRATGR